MLPESEKTTVPGEVSGPIAAYHSAPFWMIGGTVATVCTLLISVGEPYRPLTAGNGGRERGWPRFPSSDSSSADSSPQMYAPAPRCRTMVTSSSSPAARACSSAPRITSNTSRYSPRR